MMNRRNPLYAPPAQLWLPLCVPVSLPPAAPALIKAPPVWTEAEMTALHQRLLAHSLRHLADPRLGQEPREEILAWVREALTPSARPRPFSFRACVYFTDPRLNAEALAEQVMYQTRRLARRQASPARLPQAA